ncbi:MAG: protease modulator HflK [Planctomycetota bacterium]|jgi:regulator of protease activity HflC (stomatin/prohibitin superfamily)
MPEAEPTTQNPAPDRRRLLGWAALPGLIGGVVFGLSSLLTPSEGGAWQPAAVALVSLGALTLARRSELGREASPLRIRAALWFAPALVIASLLFTSTVTDLVESIRSALPLGAEELASAVGWRAGAAGVLALLLGLLAPYLAARDEAPLAAWYRTGAWLLILAGLEALAELADVSTSAFATTAEIVVGVTAVEVLTRAALASWQRFYDRVPHPGSTVAAKALTVRLLGSRRDPLTSLFGVLSDGFGVDLRGTYALVVVRRALGPVLLGLAVLGWLSTSLVSVPFDSVGVAERFGVRSPEPLEAGLHLLPPRPFGRVELVPDGAVESIDVGYRGARTDADRLWTVAHADQEYTLLLGDGLELLSINARLEYRISDPIAYVDSVQNPVATLTALAERELTRATVDRRLEDVLSENVERFGSDVAENVQSAADRRGLGIEVLGLVVSGLHPPLAVAEDYQIVVAAQVERDRLLAAAEGHAERERIKATGDATVTVESARAEAHERLARARGDATAFASLAEAYAAAPDLYRTTAYLRTLERTLEGVSFHLIDARIEADGGAIWLLE